MDGFTVIRLRVGTIKRFKLFSKRVSKTYSESLEIMMDFFEWHNYSPHQRFAKDLSAGQELNRKRIEAHIAISKSIEKAQHIPLANIEMMLRSLFEEAYKEEVVKSLAEAQRAEAKPKKTEVEMTTVSIMKYDRTNRKLIETKERLHYVLDKIEPVNNRFGKDYLRIEITTEELARFKQNLKDS